MTELLLVRHGETDWNRERRMQGHTDQPLNERGRTQAQKLAEALEQKRAGAIYTSDLSRARETAEIIAARLDLPVLVDADLREKNWGNWEGLTAAERSGVEPAAETTEEHARRVLAAIERIASLHPDERVIVVTHGGSLRRIQAAAGGPPLPVLDNCGVWSCVHEDGHLRGLD